LGKINGMPDPSHLASAYNQTLKFMAKAPHFTALKKMCTTTIQAARKATTLKERT
jgi:hypothetical protein